jgi:Zn-dependent protease with chaperone function
MQSTEVQPLDTTAGDVLPTVAPCNRDVLAGFALTALVPAAFWTALSTVIAIALGYEPDAGTIALTASAIVLFLGLIFAILRAKPF